MAHELFSRIADILSAPSEAQALIMHETLVIACHEGLKNTRHGFGNLSSQVESLCRQHNIAPQDIVAIQKMRRHSNSYAPILPEDVAYDCRALAIFVSAVVQEAIPSFLVGKIPARGRTTENIQITNYRYIRCIVREWDDSTIQVAVTNQDSSEELLLVDYMNTPDYIDFSYLRPMLREGMQLNLLDCTVTRKKVVPRLIVVEPDYLIDISTIANCFETYGHHPLLFTVNRLTPRLSNKHIVLGNFAGSALDDIINHPAEYDIKDTFRSNFREKALDYATCPDFDAASFKQDAERQVENIKGIVDEIFQTFDREKAILEPSFVCERLGIQGRVDLMTTDLKLLVEQKSGKNTFIERKYKNPHGSLHVEKHYVQVLLYYGILQYNFQLSPKNAHIQLLYSKYPLPDGLLEVEPLQKLIREAIRFRNQAVATEFWMADNGFDRMLPLLTPQTLNVEKQNDNFYNRYLLPQLTETLVPLHQLNDLERAYFTRMMTFVIKEQLVSKVGVQEGVGNCNADLWNMPLAEKKETGNIYTGLTIIEKERSSSFNGYDTITLAVPQQGEDFLPNFRRGDMIYLYAYKKNAAPDVRMSILFKGSLQEIHGDRLVVHLNDGQQNPNLISGDYFAIEHAGSDIGGTSAIRSLYTFITSNEERRQLLLGQRVPRVDKSLTLSRSYHPDYDEIILKAKQAQDYFLLIGPPGTGKTSQALQFLVREQLAEKPKVQSSKFKVQSSILLLAYTNRAVDEICNMLTENELDYIRIGNEFSCDPKYSDHLLKEVLDDNATLNSIKSTLADARIVVATTSTMNSNAALFNIKHFDLAIIDEASQILEPNIIGLLTASPPALSFREGAAANNSLKGLQRGDYNMVNKYSANIQQNLTNLAAPSLKERAGGEAIGKFILIGDHKQLPAVVQQSDTEVLVEDETVKATHLNSCANSLFERLILTERAAGRTDFIGTLHKQGRMHPDIADFANRKFYAREQLECVPLAHQLEQTLAYNETSEDETDDVLKAHRMIFIPSKPCRQLNISEKVNTEEARIITDLLRRLYRQLGKNFDPQKSVGVIVPYRNQIAMIRKEIEKLGIPELEEISIDTVERYQGSQRDIILYSFTIQSRYQLDFLTANTFYEDGQPIDRKLNVAITRARKQLILTGNEPTLRQNQIFAELIDYIKEKGGYYAEKA
ncbi:AAA family ATPase [Prevotella melaninogenica]|uniref:AAA family ATPase n=1 Tax=Prevotella melaninogenica TaxID=28132 RepID=A0ABS6Y4B0_9BACT|nr:AAA domain-containing protein [Prevotella melaninogenica]MBW4754327.1 AAA family ATPase [Prevotella melaninogenica]